MGHDARPHRHVAEHEIVVTHIVETEGAGELLEREREHRRLDRTLERLGQRTAVVLHGPVDIELCSGLQHRCEERQALDVVPVEMRQQANAAERSVVRLLASEVAQAGAEVEHDGQLPGDVDRHARRVAAAPDDVIAMARGRPPDTMKRDAERRRSPDGAQPRFTVRSL
jgi:hypothetical protein